MEQLVTPADYIWHVLNLIGSAMPLCILCFMLVFIMRGIKIRKKTVISYVIISVILFIILLRT